MNGDKVFEVLRAAERGKVDLLALPAVNQLFICRALFSRKLKWFFSGLIIYWLVCHYGHFRFLTAKCNVSLPDSVAKMFRPPVDCGFCRDVDAFDIRENLSPEEFERSYAYSGRPVKVSDGAANWTAVDLFDYWYFKEIYDDFAAANNEEFNCQFFPYKSGFGEIFEAFRMPEGRVRQEGNERPWYFGWSNCNNAIAGELRKHYTRPYFLPALSENNAVDWIFIGVPGMGAHLHVDNVRLPSWQAQLKGSKKWDIAPPPECYFQCRSFEMTVDPGEIIVLDTNKWFHKTEVLPGQVSVTIGAEYD